MLVTIERTGRQRVARLEIDPGATVSDLARALGTSPSAVTLDHTPVEAHQRLVGIVFPGSHIVLGADDGPRPSAMLPAPGRDDPYRSRLVVCGGLESGRSLSMHPGRWTVGRRPDVDLRIPCATVSPTHAAITFDQAGLRIEDLGTTNGTRLGDAWLLGLAPFPPGVDATIGANRLRVDHLLDDHAPLGERDSDGRRLFDRPPRPALRAPPERVRRPAVPEDHDGGWSFGWALVLGPLVTGAVLALWVNPALAAFALLSPVLTLAHWLEARRRSRHGRRREARRFAEELEAFRAALGVARLAERDRLRALHPDPVEVVRRARAPSTSLWHRRPADPDWLRLRAGTGTIGWTPPVTDAERPMRSAAHGPSVGAAERAIDEALAEHGTLADAPVTIDAARQRVIGIVGPMPVVRSVARAVVVDAAVHHGPSGLGIAVDTDAPDSWSFTTWLPHVLACAEPTPPLDRHLLVVTDRTGALRPDRLARQWLDAWSPRATLLVLAEEVTSLPAATEAVIEITDPTGTARLHGPGVDHPAYDIVLDGSSASVAESASRALAGLADPECSTGRHLLPKEVRLVDDLDTPATADAIRDQWDTSDPASMRCPVGIGLSGPVWLDLDRDGPHLLIAGTTGSGKSELLRTLILGLAARHPPASVSFMLVDYKGGSAFDACVDLPHTVGVVTDLDGALGQRAIRSLEAEIRRREELLRRAGAADLVALRGATARPDTEAPARLVIVVDEFAVLARESPAVLDALVDVAQRGRSLGLHLVLATQRPAGVVNEQIRTNAGTRVALRVVDANDSADVIGTRHAATIRSSAPGRAFVTTDGPLPTELQIAFPGHRPRPAIPVRIEWVDEHERESTRGDETGVTDLERIVAAVAAAHDEAAPHGQAGRRPHRPWVEPLPAVVAHEDVATVVGDPAAGDPQEPGWVVGVADDPDRQARRVVRWNPVGGPLLVYGMRGSGCTTALRTVALAAANEDRLATWVYVVGSPGEWDDLVGSRHVGAVVSSNDPERLGRLVEALAACVAAPDGSQLLLVVDGIRPALDSCDRAGGMAAIDAFVALLGARSSEFGVALASDRVSAVPGSLASVAPHKLLLRLPDPYDYAGFGLPALDSRGLPPGRAVDVPSGLELQIVQPPARSVRSVDEQPPLAGLDVLPREVASRSLGTPIERSRDVEVIRFTLADQPREPAGLPLLAGETTLIAGPDGAGRTTACAVLAAAAARAGLAVVATAPHRSELRTFDGVDRAWCEPAGVVDTLRRRAESGDRLVLIVDDADLTDDDALAPSLLTIPGLHVVAAAHGDRLRARYRHWFTQLAPALQGLALRPDPLDGELWSTTFPRARTDEWPPGRGYLVHRGRPRLVQVGRP